MERRKSQLEVNNELLNKEMKSLFNNHNNQNTSNPKTSNNGLSTTQNIAIINNSSIHNNTSNHQNDNDNRQMNDINFNNAIFNKNFIPMQAIHNDSSESETPTFNSNLNTTDVYLNDDVSLLPVIDEKSLLSTLKAKFEMRKYYVNIENSN